MNGCFKNVIYKLILSSQMTNLLFFLFFSQAQRNERGTTSAEYNACLSVCNFMQAISMKAYVSTCAEDTLPMKKEKAWGPLGTDFPSLL